MTRNNADFQAGAVHPSHPLWEGGEQPMYRWMHHGEYDEAQAKGVFKSNRNASPTPSNAYEDNEHVLVKFNGAPGRFISKDQKNFYLSKDSIPFEEATIVKAGGPEVAKKYGLPWESISNCLGCQTDGAMRHVGHND